jgi:hydroxymethylbilane synthase
MSSREAEDPLVIGTRSSQLALWQARRIKSILAEDGTTARLEEITTTGDRELDVPLSKIGDKAVFTKELDLALLNGTIDCAVHSLKDLPTALPEGLVLAAISARETPWDVFIAGPDYSGGLAELPQGATVATSALRRRAQLKAWRPDLNVVPVRGNVDTRLEKLFDSSWEGMVLAEAGIRRLDRVVTGRERVIPEIMLPAVGQGALAVVCPADNEPLRRHLDALITAEATAASTRAERAMLHRLEGGCQVPIGAWGRVDPEGKLLLDGCIATLDGERKVTESISGRIADAEALGVHLAEYLLHTGGDEILDHVRRQMDS